jgi:hypothetical protein
MPTLRDHTKEALKATEPTDQEAASDLRQVLRRAEKKPVAKAWFYVPALAAAAAATYFVMFRPQEPVAKRPLPPAASAEPVQTARTNGMHLYLRSSREPEALAIRLDLDTNTTFPGEQ